MTILDKYTKHGTGTIESMVSSYLGKVITVLACTKRINAEGIANSRTTITGGHTVI